MGPAVAVVVDIALVALAFVFRRGQIAATVAYKRPHEKRHHTVQLECVFFGPFRDAVGEKTIHHETDVATVGDLLREFEAEYPPLSGELVDDEAETLAGDTVVTMDKRNVNHIDGLATKLREDAVIRLVPSVYGG